MNKKAIITIDYIGRRGDGVGDYQGRPVFVPRALPGEGVQVRLMHDRDKGIAAQLLGVVEKSPDRVAAPCPYYDSCGGCSLQHWDQNAYRRWKVDRVRSLLDRAGIIAGEWKDPVFIPQGTRRRTTLAAFLQNRNVRLGYHRARSHDIADIPSCMVLSPRVEAIRESMRSHLVSILTDSRPADIFIQDTGLAVDVMITGPVGARKEPDLAVREAMAEMAQACGLSRLSWRHRDKEAPEIMIQAAPVHKRCGDFLVEMPPGAFMQPSAEGEAALLEAVLASLEDSKKIADLFAGCGTFAGPLRAEAFESESGPVVALQKAKIKVHRRNLFANPLTAKELEDFDAAVIDPPRMGAREQAAQMALSRVSRIASVSCNPSTFVRDAKIMIEGGYRLESLQIIDQFIWSAHIELVGVFRR